MCRTEQKFREGIVSIVTPVFNGEFYLPQMLDSILNQTYPQIEMILVDDGSTDHTIQVAEGYREKFAIKDYGYQIIQASHKNASAAINQGLPYVTGEYLIWPDSDDVLEPESVEKRVEFLKRHPQFQCVRSLSYYFDFKTGESRNADEQTGDLSNEYLFWDILESKTFVCCGCYMIKSDRFFEIYPERHIPEYPVGQNFQMLLPYMYQYQCPTIREQLYGVCVREGSHSRKTLTQAEEEKKYLDYEKLVDEITDICGIYDKKSRRRIECWKVKRRYRISIKYGRTKQTLGALYRLFRLREFKKWMLRETFLGIRKQIFHMRLYLKKEDCCGCGACVDICPVHAIRMSKDKEGFYYPRMDGSLCVHCGKCEEVCPLKNQLHQKCSNQYMGVRAKDEKVRYSSSSGGIFPILAEYVLNRKGVVYGAGYNGKMEVIHQEADDLEQLERIKKTKYVQSNMQQIFLSVKRQLKEKRRVLFCGTPCQVQAIRLFLGQEYDKLILVDLVCYGVPSPGIWDDYVKYLESRHHGKMTNFSFRDKRAQDHGHTCAYVINGKEYTGSLYQDRFCRMYFTNYTLRPSCYSCKFCMVDRDSDFTIGDFWGIEKIRPDIDDGMGTSMVILHTEKAKNIWEQVQEDMDWFECGKGDLMQPRLHEPTCMARGRRLFMMLYRVLPFSIFIRLVDDRKGLWKRVRKKI